MSLHQVARSLGIKFDLIQEFEVLNEKFLEGYRPRRDYEKQPYYITILNEHLIELELKVIPSELEILEEIATFSHLVRLYLYLPDLRDFSGFQLHSNSLQVLKIYHHVDGFETSNRTGKKAPLSINESEPLNSIVSNVIEANPQLKLLEFYTNTIPFPSSVQGKVGAFEVRMEAIIN